MALKISVFFRVFFRAFRGKKSIALVEGAMNSAVKSGCCASLGFGHTVRVLPRAGVNAHSVTDVDKQRHLDFVAIVNLGWFSHVGGGVAAGARLSFCDFLFDKEGQGYLNGAFAVEKHAAFHVVIKKICLVAENRGADAHFIIGVWVNENKSVAFVVRKDQFFFYEIRAGDFVHRTEGAVKGAAA